MSHTITLADGSVLDVARYPLPDGVTDNGTPLNRAQLAAAFGVSVNAVTDWINKGMPALSTGQNGVAYEFRLAHCWAWRQSRDERVRAGALGAIVRDEAGKIVAKAVPSILAQVPSAMHEHQLDEG